MTWIPLVILLAAGVTFAASITIVPQSKVYIIERLSVYNSKFEPGVHFKIPFIDRVAKKITLMEQMADFPPWPVITKDNVSIQVDTVVFFQVVDSTLFTYGVERPLAGVENLTSSILRNIIGTIPFADVLASRDIINTRMRRELDEATDPWGIKVNRVELREIQTPREVREAMEKQLKAGLEKTEKILRAEGDAQAILRVQEATAEAIRLINQAAPGDEYLRLQAIEAFGKAANGNATKIVIPSDIQGMAGITGLAKGLAEAISKDGDAINISNTANEGGEPA